MAPLQTSWVVVVSESGTVRSATRRSVEVSNMNSLFSSKIHTKVPIWQMLLWCRTSFSFTMITCTITSKPIWSSRKKSLCARSATSSRLKTNEAYCFERHDEHTHTRSHPQTLIHVFRIDLLLHSSCQTRLLCDSIFKQFPFGGVPLKIYYFSANITPAVEIYSSE